MPCWTDGPAPAAILALLAGCGPVLPAGERVLGDQVPAVVIDGGGQGFAEALAVSGSGRVAVASPLSGRVEVFDADGGAAWEVALPAGAGEVLAWDGEELLALAPGVGIWRLEEAGGERLEADPAAGGLAVCPDGAVVTAAGPVACGAGGTVHLACAGGGCEVVATPAGEAQGTVLDAVSEGGAVAVWAGQPCWSEVSPEVDDAPGAVRCADFPAAAGTGGEAVGGEEIATGVAGEHLGQSLSAEEGGWASGRFTRWTGQPRGRVLPLSGTAPDGATAWVVDRAADASPLVVAAGGGVVAVGVPGYSSPTPEGGRLYLVDVSALDASGLDAAALDSSAPDLP